MKSIFFKKLSLYLSLALLFCSLPVVHVSAAVTPSIDDVTAVWDSNISTEWNVVYNEYKSLNPSTRYEADKVIAANAYRFLISIGSKPLEQISQQSFDDFLRAVSPFNIAYNNVIAESVVHAAWSISSEQYRVFCANVIHNLAQGSDYYQTHVIKNDDFINGAGQGSLQIQYNDVDIDQSLNIYNNIFNSNLLTSSGGSVAGYYLNSLPSGYTGPNITYQDLCVYFNYYDNQYYNVYTAERFYSSYQYPPDYLYLVSSVNGGSSYQSSLNYIDLSASLIIDNTSSNPNARLRLSLPSHGDYTKFKRINLLNLTYPDVYQYQISYDMSQSFSLDLDYSLAMSISDYETYLKNFVNTYISNFSNIVFTPFFRTNLIVQVYSEGIVFNKTVDLIPSSVLLSYVSPQFQPVNIYNNNYYGSDDDTYFHVDQMVDNIINNDYSTVNNGTNNSFYIDNYYVPETVSNGAIQLVTSASITYNYITIINNNGSSSGGSIGTGPFDVRVINPEDFSTETIVNNNNDILNNYDFNFGDLNITNSVGTGINNAKDNLADVVTTSSINAVAGFGSSGLPSNWRNAIFGFLALGIIALVITRRGIAH